MQRSAEADFHFLAVGGLETDDSAWRRSHMAKVSSLRFLQAVNFSTVPLDEETAPSEYQLLSTLPP